MRSCSNCLQELPTDMFYRDKRTRDGLTRRCKTCHIAKSYESRQKGLARLSRHERYEYHRERQLKSKYGLSLQDYRELMERQGGVCAICRGASDEVLAVDHSHETGRVRGLLCSQCNTALGKFRDDPALLQAAISYLASCCEGEPQ